MSNNNNPYALTAGYLPSHDYAITGYGITIESINHWLYDHQRGIDPIGVLKVNPDEALDDLSFDDFDEFLQYSTHAPNIHWFSGSNTEVEALMTYNVEPGDKDRFVPNKFDINKQLVNAIKAMYAIPNALEADLTKFVDKYSDSIQICDFS